MSLNYPFAFSLLLIFLVVLNVYFLYTLNDSTKTAPTASDNVPNIKIDSESGVHKIIYEYLQYLPNQYKTKNPKYQVVQRQLINSFNSLSNYELKHVWHDLELWSDTESLFPNKNGFSGQILDSMQNSPIVLADNAPKGTQLKLLLVLEGKQKLFFKPKRYDLNQVINGNIYSGFDRHNSEVFAYYLAMVMNFTWVAPAIIRKINIEKDIVPIAMPGLKNTMVKVNGTWCIYGKCYYCKINETVCADSKGELEGAAILYLNKPFRIYKSPWRRSYSSKKMEWQTDNNYCKKINSTMSLMRLLNLIDVAIFDFLLQNGDRHRYETYKEKIVFLDNGKGLGNPGIDELDILAPLYQCCMIRLSTWQQLELLTGGSLTETVNILASFQKEKLTTDYHVQAVERRLLKVIATIQFCIGKYGSARVFKNI